MNLPPLTAATQSASTGQVPPPPPKRSNRPNSELGARKIEERTPKEGDNDRVSNLFGIVGDIGSTLYSRARTITPLSGSGLICAITGVIAGLFIIKWLLTAALVVGLSISALSIYNYVQNPDKPGDIKSLIDSLKVKE